MEGEGEQRAPGDAVGQGYRVQGGDGEVDCLGMVQGEN